MELKFSDIAADTTGDDTTGYAPVTTLDDEAECGGAVFEHRELRSEYFPCCAWVCSNFGVMSDTVWIGY